MKAAVLTGHGGLEKLEYRDVKIPDIGAKDVLLKVLACGVNNTDVNLRVGWYSKSVTGSTGKTIEEDKEDGGWNSAVKFPFIQGTDCCGRVVKIGSDVTSLSIGERVIVRPCQVRSVSALLVRTSNNNNVRATSGWDRITTDPSRNTFEFLTQSASL